MTPTLILAVYFSAFILDFLIDWFLDILNINASLKNRDRIPDMFTDAVDEETYGRSVAYTQRKGRFGLMTSLQGRLLIIVVLATGAAGSLDGLIASLGMAPYWHGLIFLASASMALGLASLPSSLYSQFVIEEEFGFNSMGPKVFFSDMAKQIPLGILLLMALLGGLYGALAWTGTWWWLVSWGFWMAFQLLMVVVYPTLIAPLFNKFTPLENGALKERLHDLAERCRFPHSGIYVMDGSRRSRHSNAYFTGLGRFRRIVIFDTLVESLAEEELEAILAHEIGHWKHAHILKRIAVSFLTSLGMFAVVGAALNWTLLYTAFGFAGPSLHALIFWLTFFAPPLSGLFTPLSNIWSRKHEYQADRYAVSVTAGPDPMNRALLTLGRDNLSNLTPHPAYSFWHYSHPALSERLAALNESADG